MVQDMAQCKTAGNIRGRHKNGIGLFSLFEHTGAFGMEAANCFPVRTSPPIFDVVMIIAFVQIK
jgi:hypothetical protein